MLLENKNVVLYGAGGAIGHGVATTFAMLDALGLPTRIPRAGRLLSGEVAALTP